MINLHRGSRTGCHVSLSLVHFQGKKSTDPPKKKKNSKKKDFKDKGRDEKSPKPQQKPSPSPGGQIGLAAPKPSKFKSQTTNGVTTHTTKGVVSGCKFTVGVMSEMSGC